MIYILFEFLYFNLDNLNKLIIGIYFQIIIFY